MMKKTIAIIAVAAVLAVALILTLWNKGVDPRSVAAEMAMYEADINEENDTVADVDFETVVYPRPMALTDTVPMIIGIYSGVFIDGKVLGADSAAICNQGTERFVDFIAGYVNDRKVMQQRSIPLCDNVDAMSLKRVTLDAYKALFTPADPANDSIRKGFYVPSADEVWYVESDRKKRKKKSTMFPVTRLAVYQRIDDRWYLAHAPYTPDYLFCSSVPKDLTLEYNDTLNELTKSPLAICNLRDDTFNFFIKCYNRSQNFRDLYTAGYINLLDDEAYIKIEPQIDSDDNGRVLKTFVKVDEDEVWYVAGVKHNADSDMRQYAIFKRIKGHWYLVANFIKQ